MGLMNRTVDGLKIVTGLDSVVPSGSTPDYVSLKNYDQVTVVVLVKNATTVTGSAISLKQATNVAGAGEKALAMPRAWRNIDTAAADQLAEFSVASDTFTTDATNSKNLMYVAEVNADTLDVTNGYDCVRAAVGNATAATVTVLYLLGRPRYGANVSMMPSAIVD